MSANTTDRLTRIRARMVELDLDALIINLWSNVVYATGFDGISDIEDPHIALVTADHAIAFIDARYYEVASKQAVADQWEVVLARHEVRERAVETITDIVATDRDTRSRIGIEDTMGYGTFIKWQDELDAYEIVATHRLIEEVREIKDADEIDRIDRAQAITDKVFAQMLEFIKPGMTEQEVALELELALRRAGAEALAFAPIVAAGINGSMPHAMPSDYRIQVGDLITMDFGAQLDGYKSDMTRTICVGPASDRQKEIYGIVAAAQQAGLDAVKADKPAIEVDIAARSVIEEAGFGEQFGHGTGHGVGLVIHEPPSLSPISEGTLKENSLITIEPGIYVEGELGIRIEDLVVVTPEGHRNLTRSPKELIELQV